LLFQRTIPGFEPSPESFAIAVEGLQATADRLARSASTSPSPRPTDRHRDRPADQQISNDLARGLLARLVDEAMEMPSITTKTKAAKGRTHHDHATTSRPCRRCV
jgi:hypothetical protein